MKSTKYLSKIQKALALVTVLMLYLLPLSAQDLVGSWSFEETSGTTTVDASGNGNDGAINGPTIGTPGRINLAFLFDGDDTLKINNVVTVPSSASIDAITEEVTMMTWVKTPVNGLRQFLFDRFNRTDDERSMTLDIQEGPDGHVQFGISSDGGNSNNVYLVSAGMIADDEWTHVAATSNGTTMKIYINGVLDANTVDAPEGGIFVATGVPLNFGAWEFRPDTWYYPLYGKMDEAKLYSRALSADEIAAEYAIGSLIGFWPFDETSDTIAYDVSGNGNDGDINGPTIGTPGKIDLAYLFDGDDTLKINNVVTVPPSASIDAITEEVTMMTWVKTPVNGLRQFLFDRFNRTDDERSMTLDIQEGPDGHVQFGISSDGGNSNNVYLVSAGMIADDKWTHVAATSDGITMKIYINGVLDANTVDAPEGGIFVATGVPLNFGAWEFRPDTWYYPLYGKMDEAKLYSRALSPDEIMEDYDNGAFIGYWPFDETSDTIAYDLSGNDNNGDINGPTIGTPGKINQAFLFDGDDTLKINNVVTVPPSASIDAITEEVTMMTWVKTPVNGLRQFLFDRFNRTDDERSMTLDIQEGPDGHVQFGVSSDGGNSNNVYLVSAGMIADDKWTHVAATSDGTTMKIYINGVLDANTVDAPEGGIFVATGVPLNFGAWEFRPDTWYYPLYGKMDEAKLYSRALSAEEIMEDYDNGALIGYWPFDEASGTIAADVSKFGNDGDINGPTINVSGMLGKAYLFDGDDTLKINNVVTVPPSASIDAITEEVTMMTWVKTPVNGLRQFLFDRFNRTDDERSITLDIQEGPDGHVQFGVSSDGGNSNNVYLVSAGSIGDDEWTHVAATSDGTTMKIYINGALDANTVDAPEGGIFVATGIPLNFGAWEFRPDTWYYPLYGKMDEPKLYSRALSAEEITADYLKTGLAGAISGTVIDKITNLPVEGVSVSDGTRSGETDADGIYMIENVPVASYTVTATTMGYRPLSVEDVDVSAYETAIVDFLLVDSADYVAFWPFEETDQDTITYDVSEYHNDGELFGPTSIAGKIDSAFLFDGVDDYIKIPKSESIDAITEEITLLTWVNTAITGARQCLFARFFCTDPDRSFVFDINDDDGGHLNFGLSKDGEGATFIKSAGGITDGEWTHVAATSDGITMKIYINGVLDAVTGDAPDTIFKAASDLHLGLWEFKTDQWVYPLSGIMDETKIWDRALSADEISYDYAMTEPTGTISGTVTDDVTDDPIQGVTVSDGTRSDDTDASGKYTIYNVPVDTGYVVSTSLFGYLPASVVSVEVTEDTVTTVDFALTESIGAISGTVTDDSTDLAIEGVIVTDGTRSDTTDAAGYYILEPVPQETYTVTAAVSGYLIMEIDSVDVTGGDTTIVDFKLIPAADLVGFWPFEETTGTVTADLSMYNNEGATFETTSTSGISKLAFQFNGSTSSVTVPQSTSLDSINDEITIISWVKMPVDTRQTILERWLMDDYAFILDVDDAGKVNFGLCGDGTTGDQVWLTSAGNVTADTWTHVAVTSDGTTMKAYINSVLDANTIDPPSAIYTAEGALHMGRWEKWSGNWANPFNGAMDQVKLYNRALTVEEIAYDFVVVGISKNLVLEDGLLEAYPNPFNYSTTISYETAVAGEVSISIYNLSGQKIHSLVNVSQQADHYTVVWDGTNATGGSVGAGVYFYTLNIDNKPVAMNKLVLLK